MKQTSGLNPDHGLRCQPMKIAFTDGGLNAVQAPRLVIPTGSTVAQPAGDDDPGRGHSILISAPFVAVIPVGAELGTVADNDPDGWVIALKPGVLGQVSQVAFDAVPKWSGFWDPFLREAAETLGALHHAELIDAACADAFADVISVHIALRYGHCARAAKPDMPLTRQMLTRIEAFVHEHIAETILVGRATRSAGEHACIKLCARFQNGDRYPAPSLRDTRTGEICQDDVVPTNPCSG